MRDVDADYYGYRDDDDGLLEPLEEEAELKSIQALEEEWIEKRKQRGKSIPEPTPDAKKQLEEIKNYFINVPSQTDIEQKIVDMKKKALLEQYVSPEISSKEAEAKEMLGLT
jgi:pre-mRNA-splicing factor ISY1